MALRRAAVDPAARIADLAERQAPEIARAFLLAVTSIRDQHTLTELADLLEQGRFEEALSALEAAGRALGGAYGNAVTQAGQDAAAFLSAGVLDVLVTFDQTNVRAVSAMQRSTLRMVTEFSSEQRAATRQALERGIAEGVNPREMARAFRDSIGLTTRQEAAVANYRRMLDELDPEFETRRLRDARFDPTVRNAIRDGRALTGAQRDLMVDRYRQRFVAYRATVIGRTEALRAVHEGTEEMYQQAIDSGALKSEELVRKWVATKDARTRDSHRHLDGQERLLGQTWTGQHGVLRYPGDPNAPASETVQCRCVLTTRMKPGGLTPRADR